MIKVLGSVLLGMLLAMPVLACSKDGKTGIAPENNQWLPSDYVSPFKRGQDRVDEVKFNQIIDEVTAVYAPIVASMGGKLVVNRHWEDGTVNAYASREGKTWFVDMFGGLARHDAVTPDGFALVMCHELGHHIAGYPKYDGDWASSEGQSDYFATAKCFKHVYGKMNNSLVFFERFSSAIDTNCAAVYKTQNEVATCVRNALGGQSLANLLADLGGDKLPKIETPDKTVVKHHDHTHPAAQCRLDTYFQGSLCAKAGLTKVGTDNYKEGYCAREDRDTIGVRPLCWFSEADAKASKKADLFSRTRF